MRKIFVDITAIGFYYSMMKRYLILNADDFGMSDNTNAAIQDLFENGFVTSTTLMTPCPAAEAALKLAQADSRFSLGVHLTTTSEWRERRWGPVSKQSLPSLCDDQGMFPRTSEAFAAKADAGETAVEIAAQLDFVVSRGYTPTHMDNHMGSLYGLHGPSFMREVFSLCSRHKLPFRLPKHFDELPDALKPVHQEAVTGAKSLGVCLPDYLFSFPRLPEANDTYETLRDTYLELMLNIKEGITEFFLHPCRIGSLEETLMGKERAQLRQFEYMYLKDADVKKRIEDAGIVLCSWKTAPFAEFA
jgi:predicted glycoside hydrolase/deacetylase ChbG (UPF0249 family)